MTSTVCANRHDISIYVQGSKEKKKIKEKKYMQKVSNITLYSTKS